MDGRAFDRLTTFLAGIAPRRRVVRAITGASLAGAGARATGEDAAAGKNKRCRRRLQPCGGKKKCCNGSGKIACQAAVKSECLLEFPGQRCCGKEGAPCTSGADDCQCCGQLFCSADDGLQYRCREIET